MKYFLKKLFYKNRGQMSKKLYTLLVLGSIIFQMIFITGFIPQQAVGAQVMPTVTLALNETIKTAHVGPDDSGEVTFNGTVSVILNPATRVVVSLNAEDTWGSAVVSPNSILFEENGEKPFGVTVRARPGEPCINTGTVTVTGRWAMYPGSLAGPADPPEGVSGTIYIAQYYDFSLYSEEPLVKCNPGVDVYLDLIINNKGNGEDTFILMIEGIPSDWRINFPTRHSVTIPPFEKVNKTLFLNIPSDEPYHDVKLDVRIESTSDSKTKDSLQLTASIEEEKLTIVGMEVETFSISIIVIIIIMILIALV